MTEEGQHRPAQTALIELHLKKFVERGFFQPTEDGGYIVLPKCDEQTEEFGRLVSELPKDVMDLIQALR